MNFKNIFFVAVFIVQTVIATSNTHTEEAVRYEETPTSQKAVLRDPALLRCVAAIRIERCRWSWRPFSSTALMRPLIVREFDAFGVGGRDCSVRFRSLLLDHEGEWTCSVLPPGQTVFHAAPTALIRVVPSADNVQFSERPQSTEVLSGESAVLRCVVQRGAQVEWCRWTWRPLNQINSPRIPIKEFPPFGNESRDCSVRFRSAQLEQAGEWSCGVRPHGQLNFQPTEPVMLTVLRREMKFVQLSQDLQVAAGETVLLRCVTASRVQQCRWMWRQFATSSTQSAPPAIQVKNFAAFGNESRDCSVRFSSVLPEQAGEWTCGVQPVGEVYFHDAPPARLNLLPAVKIRFVEVAEETRVVHGTSITLPCAVTANVSLCRWTWKSLEKSSNEVQIEPIEFLPQGNWSRDCSLTLNDVQRSHQGLWTCTVTGPPADTLYTTVPAKLTVHLPVEMEFSELTSTIQMPVGSPVLLRCIAAQRVERCRWVWRQLTNVNNEDDESSDKVTSPPLDSIREFDAFGTDNRDCSIRFRSVVPEQSGEWTCGVKPVGEIIFQDAPPAQLTVIRQVIKNANGSINHIKSPTISVTHAKGVSDIAQVFYIWRAAGANIPLSEITENGSIWSLTCRIHETFSSCFWISPNSITIEAMTRTDKHQYWEPQAANQRFWAVADPSTGSCSLVVYAWDVSDIADAFATASGRWRCLLYLNSSEHHIEASTFLSISHHDGFFTSAAILLLMTFIIFIVMVSFLLPIRFYCLQLQKFKPNQINKNPTNLCDASYKTTNKTKKIRFILPATEIPYQTSHLYAQVNKINCKKIPTVTDFNELNESFYANVKF